MKVTMLTLCLLIGAVLAMPPQQSSEETEGEASTDVMIVGCLAENWDEDETEEKNMVKVGTCLKCLEQAGDTLSADGLPKTKECVSTYMPTINQMCAQEISNVTVGGVESGMVALDCFEDSLDYMGADWCLKRSTAANIVDRMTEAVGCVLETHKNVTDFVKAVKSKMGDDQQTENQEDDEHQSMDGKAEGKMMQLLLQAHCDVAADGDVSRSQGCQQCFGEAIQQGGEDGAHMAADLSACSHSFLLPTYQDCQPGLDNLVHVDPSQSKEKAGEVHKCYLAKLLRHVVSGCVEQSMEPSVDHLDRVMQCGKQHIMQWAMQSAGPELAAVLQSLLPNGEQDKV